MYADSDYEINTGGLPKFSKKLISMTPSTTLVIETNYTTNLQFVYGHNLATNNNSPP